MTSIRPSQTERPENVSDAYSAELGRVQAALLELLQYGPLRVDRAGRAELCERLGTRPHPLEASVDHICMCRGLAVVTDADELVLVEGAA